MNAIFVDLFRIALVLRALAKFCPKLQTKLANSSNYNFFRYFFVICFVVFPSIRFIKILSFLSLLLFSKCCASNESFRNQKLNGHWPYTTTYQIRHNTIGHHNRITAAVDTNDARDICYSIVRSMKKCVWLVASLQSAVYTNHILFIMYSKVSVHVSKV